MTVNPAPKTVCLDFDGVLADKRRSCFAAALRENGARRLLGAIKEGD